MQYIGIIDKSKIGKYAERISTYDVVLTDERRMHIYEDHAMDYDEIMNNIVRVIQKPIEIIEDIKNKDTLFFVGKLTMNILNIVVRLNTTNSKKHPQNSIMTAWIIRDSNLRKMRKRNNYIYKSE
ncbi:MAG: hypothetical protein IJ220_03530 [Clostridia bacterium]|nr:hypothetical protein [Clostridia bacterium]